METSSKARSFNKGWAFLVAGATLVELRAVKCKRRDQTLSNAVRCTLRVDTPAGRAAFLVWWAWFSYWWVKHILRGIDD